MNSEKVTIQNVNVPGRTTRVDAMKYHAMRDALLKVLPKSPPGMTQKEMFKVLTGVVPSKLWPNGDKVGWWAKTVQLDLEAKRLVARDRTAKPLRWYLPR